MLIRKNSPFRAASAYASTSALTADTSVAIFLPAANANGAIVWSAQLFTVNASAIARVALSAHTSAPNDLTTGSLVLVADSGAKIDTSYFCWARLDKPYFIPAGRGLYVTVNANESNAHRRVLYTLK